MTQKPSNDYLAAIDQLFARLGLWMFDHKFAVLLLTLLMLAAGLFFASQIRTDNSLAAYFDLEDPSYEAYMQYQEGFGSDEISYLVYSVPGNEHGPFDLGVMQQIVQLTEALETEVPFVQEVTSLSNAEYIIARDDLLEIIELGIDMPDSQEALLQRRDGMMNKPMFIRSLLSEDAHYGAIILEMTATSSDPLDAIRLNPERGDAMDNLYPQVTHHAILNILKRPEYQNIEFVWSGDVPMNTDYNEVISKEFGMLAVISLALVAVIAMICFSRQWVGLFGPLSAVIVALILTTGFMSLVGYKIGLLFLIAPVLLTAIGVAQSVHLISEFSLLRCEGSTRREAISLTLGHVALPCLLAAATTAVGFLVMSGSNLLALAELAVYLGVGVLLCFLASISVMSCIMALGRDSSLRSTQQRKRQSPVLTRLLESIVAINLRHPAVILVISALLFTASIVGANRLQVSFNFLEDFKPHTQFYRYTEKVQQAMGGVLNFVLIYDSGEPDAIKNVDVLSHMAALQNYAERSPLVQKSYSIVDILKDINQSFHGDDPDYYRLPDDNALIAQYLLLYEISGGEELEDYLTLDYQRATLELRVDMVDSAEVAVLLNELKAWLKANPIDGVSIQITGIGMLWIKMANYISDSQLWGYSLAFVIIAVILCLAFRSIKVGMLAMIPNLAPVIIILGGMGWLGIHLDYFRMLLATVAIGIAVDDTVHMMSRLRKEFLRTGDYEQAVRISLMSVGRALVITTIILSSTFLVFLMSDMAVLSSFGVLLSLTVAIALLADLFLMPALVLVLKPFGPKYSDSRAAQLEPLL